MLSASAAAKASKCGVFTVDSSKVRVAGLLGDAESFTQTFRVRTTKKMMKPEFDVVRDLAIAGPGGHTISQARIEVTNPAAALTPKQPAPIRVTVKGIRFAGEYRGALVLRGSRCRIPLTVVAAGPPELGLVGGGAETTVHLLLARCSHTTCGPSNVVDWLVSDQRRRNQVAVLVDNASQSPALITDIAIAVRGDPGERAVPVGALVPTTKTADLVALAVSDLPPIAIKRDQLEPGHYTGAIYLTVAGAEKRTALPIEIDVKDGPFWAIVVLLIALGVQVLVWVAARNRPRKAELRELRRLRHEIHQLDPQDASLLEPRLHAVRESIVGGDLEGAGTQRAAIRGDAARLASARELEKVAGQAGDVPEAVTKLLAELREAVKNGRSSEANSKLTDLRNEVADSADPSSVGWLRKKERRAVPTSALRATLVFSGGPADADGWIERVQDVWAFVRLKLGWVWDEIKYAWLLVTVHPLPWLLRGLLLVVFVYAGLKELYFDDTIFGSEWAFDYGAMFLVGLTAAAANEALGKVFPAPE